MANENRLIDYQKAKEIALDLLKGKITTVTAVQLVTMLKWATVDAVEVVHARWEDEHSGKYANPRYRCSACKERALYKFERDLLDNWKEVQALTPNCPQCGARMDGENK